MFRYRNEAAFSRAFCTALKTKNWFVQRIESGETGKGIPDIYAISPTGQSFWFELKRHHGICTATGIQVQWRPGQQAWLMRATRYKQKCFTLACCDNGILVIPHDVLYSNNYVHPLLPGISFYESLDALLK